MIKPPIIILTLKDRVDRRRRLLSALESQGVTYELWFAVDGRSGLPQKYEHLVDRQKIFKNRLRYMSETEIACALSHQLIYQEILHRNLEAAIILEDDAIVDERFFEFYWLNKNFSYDLLLLHYSKAIVSRFEKLKLGRDMVAHRSLVSPYSTMGYLITREGAQKIIDQSLPISSIADWPIDLSKIWTYATFPRIIDHPRSSNVDSDIRSECIKNKRTAINQIRFNIRYYILLKILNWRFYHRKLFGILVD